MPTGDTPEFIMPKSQSPADITLPPDLHRKSGTGPVRLQQPVYVNSIPPCNHACPAGEDIQGWLDKSQAEPCMHHLKMHALSYPRSFATSC
jgi:hypothetical protein